MHSKFAHLKHSVTVLAVAGSILLGGIPSIVALAQSSQPATSAALSDATIRALQDALNKQGIAVKTDGVWNEETRAAIRKYQSQHHLPVTGEPDKATLDKLGVTSRQGSTSSEQPALAQAAPASPQQSQTPSQSAPSMQMQPGQMQRGMMMDCPMMQGQSAQPPMMQNMMQMMQGMMQMMQMMQTQMQQMQQMQAQPGMMRPGMMQPGQSQPAQR